jgi:hypothetical protein
MAHKTEDKAVVPANKSQRRKVRPNATPRLWRGFLEWLRDGRLVSFLLALSSAAALGYLFLAPAFQVEAVQVRGNTVLPSEEAITYSQAIGRNIFLLDDFRIAERLLEIPYVREARIERSLPNQVRLVIQERFPRVSWWTVNVPERYLVDDTGLVLGPEPPDMSDLIYIIDLSATPVAPKDHVDVEAVRTAQQVFSRLYNDLSIALYPFEYQPGRGITAISAAGWRACFGTTAALELKVRNLVALLQSGIQFSEVDLRIPDQMRYH